MKQMRLDDYPELRAVVESISQVQEQIRALRVGNFTCMCMCHGWDDWEYPDCPLCEDLSTHDGMG